MHVIKGIEMHVIENCKQDCFYIYRVIPVNVTNLFFLIALKVVKIEPNYWVEKKQNFIRIFQISMI